jgi:long-subunit fatty acid transport protein
MFGVMKQVNSKWQVGGDVRYTNYSSTVGAGDVPAMPGSGTIFAYTAQAIGKGVVFNNDTSVIIGSLITDPNYDSQNLSFTNSLTLQEKWRFDSTLRYYHESRNTNLTSWKATPSVRINYYWKDNMSFEAELMADYTHVDDPITVTKTDTWRESIFFGYRWDIR